MKKSEIKTMINEAINPHRICGVCFKYDANYRYYFPLLTSEKLFLGANEDEFILDGFSIRRFRDVVKAEISDDKRLEIAIAEGLLDNLVAPAVDVTDWYSVFTSLQKLKKNIIVENEDIDEKYSDFTIGKILKVAKTKVTIQHFDADGIWQDELREIPFSKVTSVSFSTRYVDIFSKYI